MDLPRFRTRTLMVAVAMVAALSSLPALASRSVAFKREAFVHRCLEKDAQRYQLVCAEMARLCRERAERARRISERCMADPVLRADVAQALDEYDQEREAESRAARDAGYHGQMRRKYERASWWPFQHATSDPPDPEDHTPPAAPAIGPCYSVR
jgi:hypothetical protein